MLAGCMTIKTPDMSAITNAKHQEIIEVPGNTQQKIFEKSKQWIALNFVSAKKVIEYENASEGKIIGNGSATVYFETVGAMTGKISYPIPIPFVMVEDIKDGKARMVFSGGAEMQSYAWEQLKPQFVSLGTSLKTYITAPDEIKNW